MGPRLTRNNVEGTSEGVEANSRLTAGAAALLLVLLAAEGVTVPQVRGLLTAHVFIGMVLIPPVVIKIASTAWRFGRYYAGSAAYRAKGPPPALLRLLGPAVVVLTIVVLVSGVVLVLAPDWRDPWLTVHKASFVLWFGAMAVHVLGHVLETAQLAPADWIRRTKTDVEGAGTRKWVLVSSVVAGCLLGAVMLGPTSTYRTHDHSKRDGATLTSPRLMPAH